jgi:UDP-N-acetylglucosamine/UDP-N-acetylgalactosamine diphosphorylase
LCFILIRNFAIWEVLREQEFSPLKNGNDEKKETPTTCRNDLYAQHIKWLKEAGAVIESQNDQVVNCEISPLVSYNGEVVLFYLKLNIL